MGAPSIITWICNVKTLRQGGEHQNVKINFPLSLPETSQNGVKQGMVLEIHVTHTHTQK